jgi:hypothetical protein
VKRGSKTPKYFKVLSVADEGGQEHHGILVDIQCKINLGKL